MIRMSLVDYLNSAPLGWSFLHGPLRGTLDVRPASPANCADQLSCGEVDVGLIPSVEYQRIPDLRIVPGIAIASKGPVRSVLLVRPHGRKIRTVALDASSRTSAALVKIILRVKMGLDPEFVAHAPDLKAMLARCDAAMIIGDGALRISAAEYEVTDLGEAWAGWQNRPFVFAFWACRPRVADPAGLVRRLVEAKAWGLGKRAEIVASYARRLELPEAFLLDYLHRNIDYEMSESHVEGLERFFVLAADAGLIPKVKQLEFVSPSRPLEPQLA